MADPNIELLTLVAEALGDLRERLVFVGGCATALLITDEAAAPVRATEDVDAITAVASLPEYRKLGEALRSRGFAQTLEQSGPPIPLDVRGPEARRDADRPRCARLQQPLVRIRHANCHQRDFARGAVDPADHGSQFEWPLSIFEEEN